MKRLTLFLLPLLIAAAGPAEAGEDRAAEALMSRGLELRRERKPQEAFEMFQRAHALAPSPRTFAQLGLVEVTLEHWVDAETHLTAALAATQDPWVWKNRSVLEQSLLSVRSHVGQISFSGPAGASVTVAGKLVGMLPGISPVRTPAGTVLVTASAPGMKQFVQSVGVQAGMETPITFALEPIDVRPPPPPPSASQMSPQLTELQPASAWRTWTGGALLTAGAGLMAWGIVWIAIDGDGSGGMCSTATTVPCKPVYDTKSPGWILTGAGAAAAAAGGFLLYSAPRSGAELALRVGSSSLSLAGRF